MTWEARSTALSAVLAKTACDLGTAKAVKPCERETLRRGMWIGVGANPEAKYP